jgi:hypothetical protein
MKKFALLLLVAASLPGCATKPRPGEAVDAPSSPMTAPLETADLQMQQRQMNVQR